MPETAIHSWNELQDQLYRDSWRPEINRFRSPYVFRGMGDASHALITTRMQLGGNYPDMEPHLLRNFRKYAHREFVELDTVWHWLSLAQHHGLPTRLFDWSVSPFVAANFATDDTERYDRDGAVWMVNANKVQELLPEGLRNQLRGEGAIMPQWICSTVPSLH